MSRALSRGPARGPKFAAGAGRAGFPEAGAVGGIRVARQGVWCIPGAGGPHTRELLGPFPGRRLMRALLTWPAAVGGGWRTDRRIDGRTVSRSGGGAGD